VRPRTAIPEISLEFRRFANANSFIRLAGGKLEIRLADILENAPAPVMEALAYILLCKLFRTSVPGAYRHRYRLYLNRQDVRRGLHLLRQARGRKLLSGAQGATYNLEEIFQDVNRQFFHGLMAQPQLSWSRGASKTVLGHFDPAHNAIVLSRVLDGPGVPRLAVEYVMYHEMLHLKHPIETRGTRRRIHTSAFRQEEKAFPHLKEAKAMLDRLGAGGWLD
jgi:hypothetical protein